MSCSRFEGELLFRFTLLDLHKWAMDIPGYLKKSEANWKEIKEEVPSDL